MTNSELRHGPPRYAPTPAASVLVAVPVTIAIVVAAQLAAGALAFAMLQMASRSGGPAADGGTIRASLMLLALLSQLVMVALTIVACRRAGVARSLKLAMPEGGGRTLFEAVALMVPLLVFVNAAAYVLAPQHMLQDFRQILELSRSDAVVTTALAIGVGAPLSEEMLFRGYLLGGLSATRIRYWPAALLACASWTLLHVNYSFVGLAEVFVIGLYLSWLLWRTNSLVPALVCHAAYNSCLLALLRFGPF